MYSMKRFFSVLAVVMMTVPVIPGLNTTSALDFGPSTGLAMANASWFGPFVGDKGGSAVAIVGDVDGDGFDDVLVGASGFREGMEVKGAAFLIYGKASGWAANRNLSGADVMFHADALGDQAGDYVSPAGDVNGDGYDDFLIASTGYDASQGSNCGKAYLFLGKPTRWPYNVNLSSADGSFEGEHGDDIAGRFLSEAGDVNGDGFDDFLISALQNDDGGWNAGKIYMMLGKNGPWPSNFNLKNADVIFKPEADSSHLGQGIAGGGDVNGDGYDDILLGAPYFDKPSMGWNDNTGKAYLFLGRPTWAAVVNVTSANASFQGNHSSDEFGGYLDILEDVNGDGLDDVLLVGCHEDVFASFVGRTYIFYGRTSSWTWNTPLGQADESFIGVGNNDCSGIMSSSAGDVNGDGLGDFIISAFQNGLGGNFAGNTYLWLGRLGGGWGKNVSLATADASFVGEGAFSYSGMLNWGGGDVNGDGYDDIVIGANGYNASQGKAYLIFPDHSSRPTSVTWVKARAPITLTEVTSALNNDTLIIEVNATDRDPARKDIALVNVTSPTFPHGFRMELIETGPSTGIFRNTLKLGNYRDEQHRLFKTNNGDVITIRSLEDPAKNTTVLIGMTTIGIQSGVGNAIEDSPYFTDIISVNGSIGQWQFETDMDWLSFNSSNLSLNGTPDNTDVGKGNVTLRLKDGFERWDNKSFSIDVMNTAPVILGTPPGFVDQDSDYLFDPNSTDDGQGNISWTMPASPAWLSMDHVTGELIGTPTNDAIGRWPVTISVDDGNGGKAALDFSIMVVDVNDRPHIVTVPNATAMEDAPYIVLFEAVDPDPAENGSLTWTLETNATWLAIESATGRLNGTPENKDVGTWPVNVTVKDARNLTAQCNYTLMVQNTNDPPVWMSYPNSIHTKVGEKIYFAVLATDPDIGDEVQYAISSEPPLSITIDKRTGTVDWTATTYGNFIINFSATDGNVTIYLPTEMNVSWDGARSTLVSPPDGAIVDTTMPMLEWTVDAAGNQNVSSDVYIDKDMALVKAQLANVLLGNMPSGTTSTVTKRLDKGAVYYWTVIPRGGGAGLCTNGVFSFTVEPAAADNRPPVLSGIKAQKITAGELVQIDVEGSDADTWDLLNLTYSLSDAPAGMSIDPRTGMITWTPTSAQVGKYSVTVHLSDGKDSTERAFDIEVEKKGGGTSDSSAMPEGLLPLIILIIIIVVIGAVVGVAMSKKKKLPETGPGQRHRAQPSAAYGEFDAEVRTGAASPPPPVPAPAPIVAAAVPPRPDEPATIDDLFIIYRDGRLIVHHTRKIKPDLDHDIIGGMFTAIQEFVKQSLGESEKSVNEIAFGDSRVLIEHGKYVYLAAAVTGEIGLKDMHKKMKTAVEGIEETFEGTLKDWNGETKPLKGAKHFLKPLLE